MRIPMRLRLIAVTTTLVILAVGTAVAQATPPPTQFVLSSYWGSGIDETTGGNICTVASKDKCSEENGQVMAQESTKPGGFNYPTSVAVDNDPASPEYNDVYVDDEINHRVQILSPTGAFVSMFGWGVNKTMDETPGATQAEKNVCTDQIQRRNVRPVEKRAKRRARSTKGSKHRDRDATSGNVYLA